MIEIEKKFYTAKYDRVFKSIFCKEENLELMRIFLSRTLNQSVEKIEFLKNELEIKHTKEKVRTVDVFALVDKEYTHIELNTSYNKYLHIRNFNYFTSLYNKSTKRGKEINTKAKFLHLDFTYGMGKKKKEKKVYGVLSYDNRESYIDNFKIIEFNMDKIMSFWYSKDEKNIQKYKHLIMLDLDELSLKELSKGDEFVSSFKKEVTNLNESEYFQSWMTEEEDHEWWLNVEKKISYEEGMEQGINNRNQEIAKKLKEMGMTEEFIEKAISN